MIHSGLDVHLRAWRRPKSSIKPDKTTRPQADKVGMWATSAVKTDGEQGETVLVSSVTAPLSANALPKAAAPVLSVMLAAARISPTKVLLVPRVAELPTPQRT